MEKYLTYEDGTSKKFWHVQTDGSRVTVTFGRIGTAGQSQTKAYPTPADAEKEAAKQAASKMKKGYAESEPPADAPAAAVAAQTAPAPVSAKKAAPKADSGPAPVEDDGQAKPWHSEDDWGYSWYYAGEAAYAHLDVPCDEPSHDGDDDPAPKTASASQTAAQYDASLDDEIEFDEDDDEDDRREKREQKRREKLTPEELLAEWREDAGGRDASDAERDAALRSWIVRVIEDKTDYGTRCYREAESHIRVLRLLCKDEAEYQGQIQAALSEGMEDVLDEYVFREDDEQKLQWLLENGAKPKGKAKRAYVAHFLEEYPKNPDPARVPEIFAAYRERIFAELAPRYAEGFRDMVRAFCGGEIKDGELPQGMIGFNISEDGVYAMGFGVENANSSWHTFEFNEVKGIPYELARQELYRRLPPLLSAMADEGGFDGLSAKGLPVVMVKGLRSGDVLLRHVLDKQAVEAEAAVLTARIEQIEAEEDVSLTAPLLDEAVSALLNGVYLPQDVERARKLIRKHLYSLDESVSEKARKLLDYYDDYAPALQYDRAVWLHDNGSFGPALNVMNRVADKGYAPARERCGAFTAEAQTRQEMLAKYRAPGAKKQGGGKLGKDNFRQVFGEADLFLNTDNVIARAYVGGQIYIRFKVEGEDAYSETLDWLNNLLEKDYASLNDGYEIEVRFLIKPVFVKQLEGFAKTSCHAFFARAVQYPALREKVKRYAENALHLYDWYRDIADEENCVTGTFAALALAFCDEQYVPLAGHFGLASDDEHQYVQLFVAGPLFKQYGPTPEVAAALFDIQCSNGQDGDINLNKALLTTPACLTAVMEHVSMDTGYWEKHHLNYHVPGYVEAIWGGNTKSNLKKLRQFADGAATPEDRNAFVDFYNFYKKYATLRDKADYGEDLEGVAEKKDVVVPVYNEDPPVLLPLKEAEKAGWVWDAEGCDDNRGFFFYPALIDDPELLDFVFEQWDVGCQRAREFDETFSCGENIERFGKWIYNTEGLAHSWGMLLTDGKNKPYVLYGVLNAAQISARWCKRRFKSAEEAEAVRQSALIREVPRRVPPTAQERELEKPLSKAISAMFGEHYWLAGQLLKKYAPEHGRPYDAALLLRAMVAIHMENPNEAAALYDELSDRRPEFAGYLAKKKAALGKGKKH